MPRKLLLADDSVTIQRVIELTFADEDIQVIAVGDGQQAIARIDAEQPDVILADIGMPERDGYEVAAHVKGNPQTAHIPVLLLTGAFEPIDEARARAVGCDGVLVKPFEPQMVINRVKDLLAGRRPESLWSTPPGPTGAVVSAQGGGSTQGAESQPGATTNLPGGDSLDDYFDRLDAAFSEGEPVLPPGLERPAAGPKHEPAQQESEFGSWDIPMERSRPVPVPPLPSPAASQPSPAAVPIEPRIEPERLASEVPTIAPELSPAPQAPELADAFAALLAAEEQFGAAAAPSMPAGPAPTGDAAIEAAVRRVLARMTDETVRAIVLDVAERLVRAEIDKIKSQAKL
ncbi:MAG: response regulator [Acidobacteriota bacterium]